MIFQIISQKNCFVNYFIVKFYNNSNFLPERLIPIDFWNAGYATIQLFMGLLAIIA
ncbi:hypothetical protein CLOSTMETH_02869 [[Clostridium] methylpentosum DSM 5476]|uniref:Uncharacterized protein n=1 Tax=[Clostridium] methylpentosum DSM 5476 TaxID=537013 RepID=C0EG76_9FIRM|nr:hypothetical protein CLOSTMETH_02869 [[Clostridium] methylpentosum DSM 5476]